MPLTEISRWSNLELRIPPPPKKKKHNPLRCKSHVCVCVCAKKHVFLWHLWKHSSREWKNGPKNLRIEISTEDFFVIDVALGLPDSMGFLSLVISGICPHTKKNTHLFRGLSFREKHTSRAIFSTSSFFPPSNKERIGHGQNRPCPAKGIDHSMKS